MCHFSQNMCHISEEISHFSQNMCHISEEVSHFSQNMCHISEETSHFSRNMCHISEETSHFSQNMCHISEETSHFSQNKYHISEETSHFSHKRSLTTQQQRAALESSNNLFGVIQSNSAQLRNQPFFKHQNTKFHALTRARTHAYGQELLLFFRHICHTETKALYFNRLHTHPTHINCHNRFATE